MQRDPTFQKLRALPVQLIQARDGVILARGRLEVKISGEGAAKVVEIVLTAAGGQGATQEEICEIFAAPDRPAVAELVEQLMARRILIPTDTATAPLETWESSLEVFYWHYGARAELVTERLNNQHIVIVGVNCVSRRLIAALIAAGVENIQVVDYPLLRNLRLFDDSGKLLSEQWTVVLKSPVDYQEWAGELDVESIDCLVATSDFGGSQLMREWNEFCVIHHRHFLPVILDKLVGYVGPLVVPGETACYECLRARENANMEDPELQRAAEGAAYERQAVTGFHPSMASVLGDLATIELTKFYSQVLPPKVGTLIEVKLLVPELKTRRVLKVPRCTVCSMLNRRSSTTPYKNVFLPGNVFMPGRSSHGVDT